MEQNGIGIKLQQLLHDSMTKCRNQSADAVQKAASLIATKITEGRLLYVIGTGGHSFMAAEELFFRAGGLACVCPLLEVPFSLVRGADNAVCAERTPGILGSILDDYGIAAGDVLIVYNAYGVNAATIDAALQMKEREGVTIALTSPSISRFLPCDHPSRHPSSKNLCDLADITIDVCVPPGDAVLRIPKVDVPLCAISTIMMSFCTNWLVATTVQQLSLAGIKTPVWQSLNTIGGDAFNRPLVERYAPMIRHL